MFLLVHYIHLDPSFMLKIMENFSGIWLFNSFESVFNNILCFCILAVVVAQLRLNSNYGVWIGFNDIVDERKWEWVDNSHVVYTNWKPGEPNFMNTVSLCTLV